MDGLTMQNTDDDLRQMLAGMLTTRTTSAKDLARRVDIDTRAAEHYRAGRHLPPLPVFIRIVREFGRDIGDALIAPETTAARLEEELRQHERNAEATRAALRAVAGPASRAPQVARCDRPAPVSPPARRRGRP